MSRKPLSRGTRGVALLVGLAGFAVSAAWPAGVALASDPDDPATTPVATAATRAAAPLADVATDPITVTDPAATGDPVTVTTTSTTGAGTTGQVPLGPVHAAPGGFRAVSVTVARTRGRNNQSLFQVSGGARQAAAVLRLASGPAFLSLQPRYAPPNRSGRYRYEVTVNYRNGKSKKVVTWSDTPGAPAVLMGVIRGVETMPTPSFPPGFPFTGGFPFN